jgi:hypothetical protein
MIEGGWESEDTPPVPHDLTGKTVRLIVREKLPPKTVVVQASSAGSNPAITILDAEAGEYLIDIPASDMADLNANKIYLIECDVFTTEDPEDLVVMWWDEVSVRAKTNPAPTAP